MRTSKKGIDIICEIESFRSHPYPDGEGVPTIGFGSTYYKDGRHVKLSDPPITESQAHELMAYSLQKIEQAVEDAVRADLTQNQFDALISLTYNIGIHAFETSTLLRLLNTRDVDMNIVASQFTRWNKDNGKVSHGLVNRRAVEKMLFLTPDKMQ